MKNEKIDAEMEKKGEGGSGGGERIERERERERESRKRRRRRRRSHMYNKYWATDKNCLIYTKMDASSWQFPSRTQTSHG